MTQFARLRLRVGPRWRTPVIVAASLGLHVLLLGYLGFHTFEVRSHGAGLAEGPVPRPVIYLEIEPRRPGNAEFARTRRTSVPERQAPPPPVSDRRLTKSAAATGDRSMPPPVPGVGAPTTTAGTAGIAMEDPWRVRPGVVASPRLICPPSPENRLGRRLCAIGPDVEPETYAETAPSRRTPSDRRREEGFDEQARANDAWREYTRGEGDYPGLRSLFRHR